LHISTIFNIPFNLRPVVAEALAELFTALGGEQPNDAEYDLLRFGVCVLPHIRGGYKHHRQMYNEVVRRVTCWRVKDKREELWLSVLAAGVRRLHLSVPSKSAVIRQIAAGRYSAASRMLSSLGVAPCNDATKATLRAIHPEGSLPVQPQVLAQQLDVSEDLVLEVLAAAKPSAPGPDGFRIQWLKQCVSIRDSPLRGPLVAFVRRCLQGNVDGRISDLLTVRLLPLNKPVR